MTTQSIVYTGSYAEAGDPGIRSWSWDSSSASLSPIAACSGIPNPTFLIRHPGRSLLFAVEETANGAVWALRVDETGRIEALNRRLSGGDSPCHLSLDPSGRWLIASNYSSGSVAVFPVLDDGSLGERSHHGQHQGSGPHAERQEGPHAHSATWTPDGRYVIVADLGIDRLVVYTLDQSDGTLRHIMEAATPPGSGPRHVVFDASGRHLFVANELSSTVSAFEYDAGNGHLSPLETVSTLPPDAPENYVADIHLAGSRLLVSNRGHNSLAVFDVRPDGGLPRVAVASCGGNWPRNFAVAPGNSHVLVANQDSGEVVILPLNDGPAPVGEPIGRVAVPGASCVIFEDQHA